MYGIPEALLECVVIVGSSRIHWYAFLFVQGEGMEVHVVGSMDTGYLYQ